VASFAVGLTPIVFVLTGAIFYLTAATYSEATATRSHAAHCPCAASATTARRCSV
jgi:hypothetical protein